MLQPLLSFGRAAPAARLLTFARAVPSPALSSPSTGSPTAISPARPQIRLPSTRPLLSLGLTAPVGRLLPFARAAPSPALSSPSPGSGAASDKTLLRSVPGRHGSAPNQIRFPSSRPLLSLGRAVPAGRLLPFARLRRCIREDAPLKRTRASRFGPFLVVCMFVFLGLQPIALIAARFQILVPLIP